MHYWFDLQKVTKMSKNQTLDEFYTAFREEVLCASDTETSGWTIEDFLTNVMMEYLEEAGEVTDPVICPFRGYGLQMNGYAISEDYESVDIFVSIYSDTELPRSVSQTDVDAAIKRAIQLYHKAINDLYTSFQKDNDTYEFAITLHKNKDNIKHVRICALTNGLVKPITLKNITIGCAEVSFSLWDIDRLYRCVTSGKMRETIEIDFEEKFQTTIPCIENSTSKCSATRFLRNSDRILEKKAPVLRNISEARSLASAAPKTAGRPTQEGGLFRLREGRLLPPLSLPFRPPGEVTLPALRPGLLRAPGRLHWPLRARRTPSTRRPQAPTRCRQSRTSTSCRCAIPSRPCCMRHALRGAVSTRGTPRGGSRSVSTWKGSPRAFGSARRR